jgi:hypothetical protein
MPQTPNESFHDIKRRAALPRRPCRKCRRDIAIDFDGLSWCPVCGWDRSWIARKWSGLWDAITRRLTLSMWP